MDCQDYSKRHKQGRMEWCSGDIGGVGVGVGGGGVVVVVVKGIERH